MTPQCRDLSPTGRSTGPAETVQEFTYRPSNLHGGVLPRLGARRPRLGGTMRRFGKAAAIAAAATSAAMDWSQVDRIDTAALDPTSWANQRHAPYQAPAAWVVRHQGGG